MKRSNDPVTQHELDRLVEGELNQTQRRELISRIENGPDGWRQCALSFLQAQSWRKSFRSFVAIASDDSAAVSHQPTMARLSVYHLAAVLVATIVISLGIGVGIAKNWMANDRSVVNHKPDTAAITNNEPENLSTVQTGESQVLQSENVAVGDVVRFLGYVNYGIDDENARDVPIISGPGFDDHWLASRPAPLSEYELSQLEARGWQVHQQRRLMKIQYTDGRLLTVPIDSVSYEFVPPRVY